MIVIKIIGKIYESAMKNLLLKVIAANSEW